MNLSSSENGTGLFGFRGLFGLRCSIYDKTIDDGCMVDRRCVFPTRVF
jgi:hypothetical protein